MLEINELVRKLFNNVIGRIKPKDESREYFKFPCVESFDALVVPTTYKIGGSFHYVTRVMIDFRYATSTESFLKFGTETALTDPILIKYRKKILFTMTNTADLGIYSYDVSDLVDDAVTKFHTVHCRYSFDKFAPEGLRLLYGADLLELIIQEDLSSTGNTSLTFTFEGWYR